MEPVEAPPRPESVQLGILRFRDKFSTTPTECLYSLPSPLLNGPSELSNANRFPTSPLGDSSILITRREK
jgi:hypothetical protein